MTEPTCDDYLDGAGNVMVCAPSLSDVERDICSDLLTITDPGGQDMLFVTFSQSHEDVIQRVYEQIGELPNKLGIITVGDFTRSAAMDTGFISLDPSGDSLVASGDPSDAVEVGIKISEYFESRGVSLDHPSDNQIVVCFDSLTSLLQYEDLPHVFRFLHVLTRLLKSIDAVAHFHIDPEAHGDECIPTLRTLFDAVVEYDEDEDEDWIVTKR